MEQASRTVFISGAGIAGLAAALFLARQGYRIIMVEKQASFETVGAGIQLTANAMHILDKLGLLPDLLRRASQPKAISIYSQHRDKPLEKIPLGVLAKEKYGFPFLTMRRSDLIDTLMTALRREVDIELIMGGHVVESAFHQDTMTFMVSNQEKQHLEFSAGLAIGADGIHSELRRNLLEKSAPKFTGQLAYRAMVNIENFYERPYEQNHILLWMQNGFHAVAYSTQSPHEINLVMMTKGKWLDADYKGQNVPISELDPHLDKAHPSLAFLINYVEELACFPILHHTAHFWAEAPVALIGDAAHAMTPHLAQGAAMALEDAYILSEMLKNHNDLQTALAQYQSQRAKRVRLIAKQSQKMGRIYQMGGIIAPMRNTIMQLLGGERLAQRQKSIYAYKP